MRGAHDALASLLVLERKGFLLAAEKSALYMHMTKALPDIGNCSRRQIPEAVRGPVSDCERLAGGDLPAEPSAARRTALSAIESGPAARGTEPARTARTTPPGMLPAVRTGGVPAFVFSLPAALGKFVLKRLARSHRLVVVIADVLTPSQRTELTAAQLAGNQRGAGIAVVSLPTAGRAIFAMGSRAVGKPAMAVGAVITALGHGRLSLGSTAREGRCVAFGAGSGESEVSSVLAIGFYTRHEKRNTSLRNREQG